VVPVLGEVLVAETEINECDFVMVGVVDHDVLGLQVSVDVAFFVERL